MLVSILVIAVCLFCLYMLWGIGYGMYKVRNEPHVTEDDRWVGGATIFGIIIIALLYCMLIYVMTIKAVDSLTLM